MMRIKIEHIHNTLNYGSLMMAVNTIKKLNDSFKYLEFYVDCATTNDLERVKRETNIDNIYIIKEFPNINKSNKIFRVINRIKSESEFYDFKIVLGGDDISEYYGKNIWLKIFPMMFLEYIKLPTFLIGQTIGPFTSYRRLLAKYVLNRAKIYTRDDKCLDYLKAMGVKTLRRGRDLAFLSLPIQENAGYVLNKYNLSNDKYITIIISGLNKWYTKNYEKYIQEQIKIIKILLNNEKLNDTKLMLLPHVLSPNHVDDRKVMKEVIQHLNDKEKIRVTYTYDEILASEAREILGNGLFTITGRMHGAVSTFYMRKPAISLSYSVKYAGVIGDGLDMNELVIESADNKLWEGGEISKLVDEKVNFVLNNYDKLIKKIDINVSKTSKITEEQLSYLVDEIKKIKSI